MSTHPDINIALAYDRIAEHHEWAAQRRLGAGSKQRRRSIMQSLARLGHRPGRQSADIAVAPVVTPFPAPAG
jgi:hypothetical protein